MEFLEMAEKLISVRCAYCSRLLARIKGQYEIKCPKCKSINRGKAS